MDLLDRLHQRLSTTTSALEETGRLTVGDLYQRLIPYRSVRADLDVLELAQYEHALLRLLSGERGYLQIDDPQVREEFQRELASVNPILGIYRDYAATEVRVAGTPAEDSPAGQAGGGFRIDERSRPEAKGEGEATAAGEDSEADQPARIPRPVAESIAARDEQLDGFSGDRAAKLRACDACGRDLPPSPEVRYCPYCGSQHRPKSCMRCGTLLESDWGFCIRCGTPRTP